MVVAAVTVRFNKIPETKLNYLEKKKIYGLVCFRDCDYTI